MPPSRSSNTRQALVSYAARILSMRPYFSNKLRHKLQERSQTLNLTDSDEEIEKIITDLKQSKFLDDLYLAQGYVRKELNKGWGPKIIFLKLKNLGVDSGIANEALLSEASLKLQQESIAHYLKKLSRYDPRSQKNKLFQRGFNSTAIMSAFDSTLQED